ncbi:MAG: 4-hydroxy-tetrahydrodipicolinate synthase [Armatimonadetes bacterium]|nr:4-hydroxy-tetrahydrodipicolinate synthase [Armatimonadota bacterium]
MADTDTRTPPFGRVLTAMATPFDASGGVDYEEAARLARYLAAHGSDGLVVAGTTGESATLTADEKIRLFGTVREAVGKDAKVLAGTGSYNTAETITLSREAQHLGVDGLLVVTPYYNRPSQEGLYQHYKAVADAVTLPVMLYNVPTRTSVNMEAATVLRLAEIANVVALKEASPSMSQVAEVVAGAPATFAVYSGADENNLPILALGGVGIVSVVSHVAGPDLAQMHTAFFDDNDLATARRIHLRTLPLTKAMFSAPSPVPTKTALCMLDVLPNSLVRLPLVEANDRERAVIHAALKDYCGPVRGESL